MTCADFNGTTNLSLAAHADKPEETRCWVLHLQNLGREGGQRTFGAQPADVGFTPAGPVIAPILLRGSGTKFTPIAADVILYRDRSFSAEPAQCRGRVELLMQFSATVEKLGSDGPAATTYRSRYCIQLTATAICDPNAQEAFDRCR